MAKGCHGCRPTHGPGAVGWPPMSENHIALVQHSFSHLAPSAGRVAEAFYRRLFAIDPSLRSRFARDLEPHGRGLVAVAEAIVSDLAHPGLIHAHSQTLARQFQPYDVGSRHYTAAGVALLGALREIMGDEFTPELEVAWARVYTSIADTLQELTFT